MLKVGGLYPQVSPPSLISWVPTYNRKIAERRDIHSNSKNVSELDYCTLISTILRNMYIPISHPVKADVDDKTLELKPWF